MHTGFIPVLIGASFNKDLSQSAHINPLNKIGTSAFNQAVRVNPSIPRPMRDFRLGYSSNKETDISDTSFTLPKANFLPVSEEVTNHNLKVHGIIPKHLNGLYVRNGPNALKASSDHIFMGDPMLHGVWISDGKAVAYKNRSIKMPVDAGSGKSNVSVLQFNQRLFALGESGSAIVIDPQDLTATDTLKFDNELNPHITAHPKKGQNGDLHLFRYDVIKEPFLQYMHVDNTGILDKIEPIVIDSPKMMHDFAITENYVLFLDLPVQFSLSKAITGLVSQFFGMKGSLPFNWNDTGSARIGVLPKVGKNADMTWLEIEPCFIFHTVNAYEKNDAIVFDTLRYEKYFDLSPGNTIPKAYLTRFEMDLKRKSVIETRLGHEGVEFPQVNRNNAGSDYQYAYCLGLDNPDGSKTSGLMKYDLLNNRHQRINFAENLIPSEFVFEPNETLASPEEDDGVLMGYVYDKNTETSSLWIFDAKTFEQQPQAIIDLGVRVPNGFHGIWASLGTTNP